MALDFSTAMSWLQGQVAGAGAVSVTLTRGVQTATFNAIPGSQLLLLATRLGQTRAERTQADLIIKATDYAPGGTVSTPQLGDLFAVTIGGNVCNFELSAPGGGQEPAWRYADPYRTMIRVHLKATS